jgi:release factor glutamine methyltransferase
LLLQHSLQVGHPFLVAHRDRALTGEQEQKYRRLIERAGQKEPVPYLVGQAPFYGLEFIVNPAVLIPRPETEQLVEAAVHWANVRRPWRIADIGTGSGCIAVTLALHLPQSRVDAVDISAEALAVAQQNAQRHAPGRIHFHLGHLLTPLLHQPDLITANLPYVADGEWTMLDDGVKLYEPAVALRGGPDGLDLIRQLLQQATSKLNPGGAIFLEVGWRQGPAAQHLAQTYFPTAQIDLMADYAGHDRIVAIKCG